MLRLRRVSPLSQQSASDVGPRCRHDSNATENRAPGFQSPSILRAAESLQASTRARTAQASPLADGCRHQLTAESLGATMTGKTWQSDEAEALVDEHPLAYKNVKEVMEAQRDLVRIDQRT